MKTYVFDSIQKYSLITMFSILYSLVFIGSVFLIGLFSSDPGGLYALYIILFILVGVVIGAWLWVVIDLPIKISREFDQIKNRIATGEISSIKDFSSALASFLVTNFTLIGFDVIRAVVKIKYESPVLEPASDSSELIQLDDLVQKSSKSKKIINLGRCDYEGHKVHGYMVPVWFGEEWLGFFIVYTERALLPFYKDYLLVFREQFVDDQLLHVLHHNNLRSIQYLCTGIDIFSKQIERKEFQTLEEYLEKLIELLIKETECKGGIIQTAHNVIIRSQLIPDDMLKYLEIPETSKTIQTSHPIYKLAFVKKVDMGSSMANIILLDNNYEAVTKARSLLDSCLAVKVANQITRIIESKEPKSSS